MNPVFGKLPQPPLARTQVQYSQLPLQESASGSGYSENLERRGGVQSALASRVGVQQLPNRSPMQCVSAESARKIRQMQWAVVAFLGVALLGALTFLVDTKIVDFVPDWANWGLLVVTAGTIASALFYAALSMRHFRKAQLTLDKAHVFGK